MRCLFVFFFVCCIYVYVWVYGVRGVLFYRREVYVGLCSRFRFLARGLVFVRVGVSAGGELLWTVCVRLFGVVGAVKVWSMIG